MRTSYHRKEAVFFLIPSLIQKIVSKHTKQDQDHNYCKIWVYDDKRYRTLSTYMRSWTLQVRRRLFIMTISVSKSSSVSLSITSILFFTAVFVSSANNLGCTSVFDLNLDSTRCNLLCESIPNTVTTIPISENITNTAIIRPADVTG